MAQDGDVDCTANPDDPSCVKGDTIVVTGSRIARPDYVSNSPTITVDQEFLQQSSTSAIEQQLNKLPQFVVSQSSTASNNSESGILPAGGDIQPNATNTPGAATVSLRGVGANRTLVLIDGRRGTPGNAGGAVDVSTIPNAALERVEVISGGASATYGADAVAGVTNFILKKDFQGIELDAQMGFDQRGNGFEYQIGGIVGTDFPDGRGNVSLAMSMNTREPMLYRDNPWYRELWADPNTTNGQYFFVPRPGVSGVTPSASALAAAFPGANPAVPAPGATGSPTAFYVNEDGSLFTTGYNARGGSAFFQPWQAYDVGGNTVTQWGTTAVGTLKYINAFTPQTVPTTRYNFLARGNYEINDWIGVFGQGMFSNNTTYTAQEPAPITFGWDVMIPWGSGVYTGEVPGFDVVIPGFGSLFNNAPYQNPSVPASVLRNGDKVAAPNPIFGTVYNPYVDPTPNDLSDNPTNPAFQAQYGSFLPCANNPVGGCSNTDVFEQVVPQQLQALLNSRTDPNAPISLSGFLPTPRATYSDVTTYSLIAGLEGSIPGTDWTWEAFVNHGISRTLSRQTGMYSLERMRAVFTAPNFGQNFSDRGNDFGGQGGLNAGFGASTGTCTTGLNFFGGYQGISSDCTDAIAADVSNRSTTRQTIVETNLQGGLFDLPAGQLRFAVGASYRENRYEFVNETLTTAGRSFLDQVAGIYPSTNMENDGIDAKEIYGELLVPVLHDIPFIQEFNLELGGRLSHYNTTGTSYTFKILGDWQVTDWLRFRGGFNRAERMPNIAELLLTPQQAFRTDPIGDVCSTRHNNTGSANPTTNTTNALDVQAMCLALMERDNGGIYVPIDDPNGNSYYDTSDPNNPNARQPTGGGFAFSYAIGNQYYREHFNPNAAPLKSEIADTWTAGAVIQAPFRSGPLSRLNLTVDYFNINIKDPIGAIGAGGILLRCVNPMYNAAAEGVAAGATDPSQLNTPEIRARAQAAIQESTCPTVYRTATNDQSSGALDSARILGTYGNEGGIKLSGIDATMSWSNDLGPGTVFLSLNGNYMLNFKVQAQDGQPFIDYVGTTGTGALGVNSGSSFEYRIFGTVGYNWGPANLSLQWQHTPATEDGQEALFLNGLAPAGTDTSGLPTYDLFSLNGSYQVNETVRIRFGVDNLFNRKPPITNYDTNLDNDGDGTPDAGALRQGGYSLFHDVQGRRFSLGANVRF
jgi:outer membrane receptor protein involved in Fe transport